MRRVTATVAGLCALGLLAPLCHPLVGGRIFAYNDLSWFHLPMRYLYKQALTSGDSVLWTPSIYAGFYLQGEGQVGMFHPWHQLLYRLLPLAPAFNLELIANYVAAFAGMTWLLKRLRFSTAASLFGAMLFAFSGFNLLHHHHLNVVAVVAHLPWLLAAADMAITDPRRAKQTLGLVAVALILGSEFLVGFPQAVYWNLITLTVFGVLRAFEASRWRALVPCAAAVGIGILLGGIQLLPTLDAALHSTRRGLSSQFALTYSLHPFNLVQLWSPYFFREGAYSTRELLLFHEFGIYSGAVFLVGLMWVWMRRRALPERQALIVTLTACASVALVLALGSYGGLATVLAPLPVLQSLRAPVRYIVLVQFSSAILAAVMLDDLLAIADGRSRAAEGRVALWIPLGLGVLTTLTLNTGLVGDWGDTLATASAAGAGVAVVGVVTLLVFLAGRGVRWAVPLLVVVTAADLGAWGIGFVREHGEVKILELIQEIRPAPDDLADSYAFVPKGSVLSPNLIVMRGYRLTGGYVGLFPALAHRVDSPAALRLSGTRWVFGPDGTRHPFEGGVPRVRLTDERGRARAGTVRLTLDRPGLIVADVDAPAGGVVALTERFHDGWTAASDTTSPRVVRVEHDFLGCIADAGRHRVTFRFVPRSFTYGWISSVIGALLLAGMLVARWFTAVPVSS